MKKSSETLLVFIIFILVMAFLFFASRVKVTPTKMQSRTIIHTISRTIQPKIIYRSFIRTILKRQVALEGREIQSLSKDIQIQQGEIAVLNKKLKKAVLY